MLALRNLRMNGKEIIFSMPYTIIFNLLKVLLLN